MLPHTNQLTEDQVLTSITEILSHYGKLVLQAQGTDENPRRIVGAVTLQVYEDGQYGYGFAGILSKGMTLGALTDVQLTFRDMIMAQEVNEQIQGMFEASMLQPEDRH